MDNARQPLMNPDQGRRSVFRRFVDTLSQALSRRRGGSQTLQTTVGYGSLNNELDLEEDSATGLGIGSAEPNRSTQEQQTRTLAAQAADLSDQEQRTRALAAQAADLSERRYGQVPLVRKLPKAKFEPATLHTNPSSEIYRHNPNHTVEQQIKGAVSNLTKFVNKEGVSKRIQTLVFNADQLDMPRTEPDATNCHNFFRLFFAALGDNGIKIAVIKRNKDPEMNLPDSFNDVFVKNATKMYDQTIESKAKAIIHCCFREKDESLDPDKALILDPNNERAVCKKITKIITIVVNPGPEKHQRFEPFLPRIEQKRVEPFLPAEEQKVERGKTFDLEALLVLSGSKPREIAASTDQALPAEAGLQPTATSPLAGQANSLGSTLS